MPEYIFINSTNGELREFMGLMEAIDGADYSSPPCQFNPLGMYLTIKVGLKKPLTDSQIEILETSGYEAYVRTK